MSVLQAIILGIIQGLAEFLPISSSGHLVLFQKIFGISEGGLTFGIILHIGTLIPVLIVYRETILKLLKKPFQKLTYQLILATIPTVIVALIFGDFIDGIFESGKFLAFGFIYTGILLLISDKVKSGNKSLDEIEYKDSLIVGIMQSLAIPPGVSRSGSTIVGATARKLNRESAAEFSFLMSIPAILGSAVLEAYKIFSGKVQPEHLEFFPTLMGFAAAMLSGYLAITFMMKLIKKAKLSHFAYYVFILGVFVLVDQNITHLFFK